VKDTHALLNTRELGADTAGRAVVLLHGLFGSSANWLGIARELAADGRHGFLPDLRNHGRSFHHPDVSYPALAGDLLRLLDARGIEEADLVGHSMGAKASMWLALAEPARVHSVVAVDSAPVVYPNRFDAVLAGLQSIQLDAVGTRADADAALASWVTDRRIRDYLLQNLVRDDGAWRWRINLAALTDGIGTIVGWPEAAPGAAFPGRALFLYGGASDYVLPAYESRIRQLFPYARLRSVAGAGHWVYADRPADVLAALRSFLD
jgi:esterase